MTARFNVGERPIGAGCAPLLVAEISGNHNGSLERALALIDAAEAAGADAVKFQTYTADSITLDHEGEAFVMGEGLWRGRRLYDLYAEASTPYAWHGALFERARLKGLIPFSSPFDAEAVALLEELDCPAFKIASFELVDLPLIRRAAASGRPLIMSTGMAGLGEIEEALAAARSAGAREIALLHCVSSYPAPAADSNLLSLTTLAAAFGVPVGLSDHTEGSAVAVAAVALGACLIEKHFTLDRRDGGPDAAFSLEPLEFKRLTDDCRTAYAALGRPERALRASEAVNQGLRRSLYFVEAVKAGDVIEARHVRSIRPGGGLAPKHLDEVLGRRARLDRPRGAPVSWSVIE